MEVSMIPCCKPHNLSSGLQLAHAGRRERLGRQIDGIPGTGALRRVNGLEAAVRQSVGWISRWRQRRSAIRKLQALNDHYLKDIGLDRSEIVSSVENIIETGDQPP